MKTTTRRPADSRRSGKGASLAHPGGPATKRPGSWSGLGPLQVEVLVLAWEGGRKGVTVRELYEQMRAERPIAYTTVMTELGSLTTKGLLVCDSSQTVYRYRPAIPPRRVRGTILDQIVAVFYRGQAAPAVARLLGLASLTENGLEQLRREAQRLQS